jgi:acyl-CoA thioester hydrolase
MTQQTFRKSCTVGWRDVDALGHMANVAYLDTCVDVRFAYFASRGLSGPEMLALGIGPVVQRDEVDYYRELRFQESYEVDLELAGLSDDGSHFRLQNRFFRADGKLAAQVVSTGGWMNLAKRQLVAAPEPVLSALLALHRSETFEPLKPSAR